MKEKKVGQVQAEISQEVWMIITNGIGIGIPVDQCQYTFQKTICWRHKLSHLYVLPALHVLVEVIAIIVEEMAEMEHKTQMESQW